MGIEGFFKRGVERSMEKQKPLNTPSIKEKAKLIA
jgi:hypothetical protein